MKIELLENKVNPIDLSVGSARTCYSVNLKTPGDITDWEGKGKLLLDLFKSGHHTTLQHVNFTFLMEGISRLSIWRFFHSHRFYNSDQVSQRYTEVKEGSFKKFDSERIESYHKSLMSKYQEITNILIPIYEASENKVERKLAKKKAMENARYILPQSVLANMYHTINLSTLLRYVIGKPLVEDCNEEVSEIVSEMVSEVVSKYPDLKDIFNYVEEISLNADFSDSENILKDIELDSCVSKLIESTSFNSIKNSFIGETSGVAALFNTSLGLESFTFNLKLSLSADAQNQRHRTAYSIRPSLSKMIESNKHDYYIPEIFYQSEEALELYSEAIYESKAIVKEFKDLSPYLLLNGFQIPIVEVNNALDFIHKSEKRLCLNSQEEITKMTWSMVLNLIENEKTKKYGLTLAPPCYHRFISDKTPICPEGSRFCGIKEWKNEKYQN